MQIQEIFSRMAARPTLRLMIGHFDHQTVQLKQRLSSLRRQRKTLFFKGGATFSGTN